jgi:hypothetical protein
MGSHYAKERPGQPNSIKHGKRHSELRLDPRSSLFALRMSVNNEASDESDVKRLMAGPIAFLRETETPRSLILRARRNQALGEEGLEGDFSAELYNAPGEE